MFADMARKQNDFAALRQKFGSLACAALLGMTAPVGAFTVSDLSEIVRVSLLPGWRAAPERHFAAIRMELAPGWKTYWRAPGDGGIASQFDWRASDNIATARVIWPRPTVFREQGMRSIGYENEVVLPIALTPVHPGDMSLNVTLRFGICKEVCLPAKVTLGDSLSKAASDPVPDIVAAIALRAQDAEKVGLGPVLCRLVDTDDGYRIEITFDAPPLPGDGEAFVVETADPTTWVSEPVFQRQNRQIRAVSDIVPAKKGKAPDPDLMHFTLITSQTSVEKQGCDDY